MLILLRLAEDVITFQTLPTQRRRDIQQTLTQNMENIFSFMMAILHVNVEDYRKLVSRVMMFILKQRWDWLISQYYHLFIETTVFILLKLKI